MTLEYLDGDRKGIAVCSMTRPKAKNAFGRNLSNKLKEALDTVKFDKTLTVMIIRSGVPGIFSAGADLKERLSMPEQEVGPFVTGLRQMTIDLTDLPIPTIAALDGAALGGGLEFALSCDLRVAASVAKLGQVETRLAIMPGAGGTQRLARIAGTAVAKDLIFTARVVDGNAAFRLGVVNYVVEQNEAGDAAFQRSLQLAEQIAQNGPVALRMAKMAINKGSEVDLTSGLAFEQAYYAQTIHTKDRMEGIRAFNEKRRPQFKGE